MRILLVNKFLYPKGGDAIVTLETGKLLAEKGHEVFFWGMNHPQNSAYPYQELFVPFVDFDGPCDFKKKLSIIFNMFYSFPAKVNFEKFINKIKPDIVHLHNIAHQLSPSIIDVLKKYNIPAVMTMHDYKLICPSYKLLTKTDLCGRCKQRKYYHCFIQGCVKESRLKSLINVIEMYLHHCILYSYSYIKYFISPSRFLETKFLEMGFRGNIIYLPNFIKTENYIPNYESKNNCFVYFGRLSNEKGLLTLIEAFRQMPKFQLKIIGEGPLRKKLEEAIAEKGIANVVLLGHLSGKSLQAEVGKSLAVVIPSQWYENNPLSVIESFAQGKPVIGANIGGISELIKDNETGFTFEQGNVKDLCFKVNCAARDLDKMKQMGFSARRFVEEKFNIERHYASLMSIYQQARLSSTSFPKAVFQNWFRQLNLNYHEPVHSGLSK